MYVWHLAFWKLETLAFGTWHCFAKFVVHVWHLAFGIDIVLQSLLFGISEVGNFGMWQGYCFAKFVVYVWHLAFGYWYGPMDVAVMPIAVAMVRSFVGNHSALITGPP